MPDFAWLAAALACAVIGMGWLALSMDVHWRQLRATDPWNRQRATVLRALGFSALAGSLVFCLLADTATMATLVWMMFLALGALTIAFVLTSRPRWLSPLIAWARGTDPS